MDLIINKNIKFIREYFKLSQTQFGAKVGATKTMIQAYESGKANPKKIVLEKIAEMSGLSNQQISFGVITLDDLPTDEVENNLAKITEGEYLRRAIRSRGMTIEEAAIQLNISRSNLHHYLNKEVLPEKFKNQVYITLGINLNEGLESENPSNSNMLVISEADLRRLITECVNDALRQFILKAVS